MIIGIDPGLDGGIASVLPSGALEYAVRMPTLKHDSGRRYVSPVKLRPLARVRAIERVAIEWVWAFPSDGASIAFGFGAAYGIVWGSFGVLHPVNLVAPQKWKRPFGLPGGSEGKDQARELAAEMWPDSADLFKYKKDSGRADAALIAEYERTQS